jgi:hypothetical protein
LISFLFCTTFTASRPLQPSSRIVHHRPTLSPCNHTSLRHIDRCGPAAVSIKPIDGQPNHTFDPNGSQKQTHAGPRHPPISSFAEPTVQSNCHTTTGDQHKSEAPFSQFGASGRTARAGKLRKSLVKEAAATIFGEFRLFYSSQPWTSTLHGAIKSLDSSAKPNARNWQISSKQSTTHHGKIEPYETTLSVT